MSQNSINLETIAKQRNIAPGSFAVALLMFFLPFCDISCNGQKAISLTGVNLALGTQANSPMGDGESKRIPGSFMAIVALAAAIAGAGVYVLKHQKEALIGTAAGALGFLSLIMVKSQVNSKIKQEMASGDQSGGLFGMTINIEANFLFAFWLAVLAFIVAGVISYARLKMPPSK